MRVLIIVILVLFFFFVVSLMHSYITAVVLHVSVVIQ